MMFLERRLWKEGGVRGIGESTEGERRRWSLPHFSDLRDLSLTWGCISTMRFCAVPQFPADPAGAASWFSQPCWAVAHTRVGLGDPSRWQKR